jgi:hypothetical protein
MLLNTWRVVPESSIEAFFRGYWPVTNEALIRPTSRPASPSAAGPTVATVGPAAASQSVLLSDSVRGFLFWRDRTRDFNASSVWSFSATSACISGLGVNQSEARFGNA